MVKNKSHTLAYSLIALQEMNLAFKYPIVFWNCACLIADSGGTETEDEEEYEVEINREESYTNCIEDFVDEDNNEEEDEDDEEEDDGRVGKAGHNTLILQEVAVFAFGTLHDIEGRVGYTEQQYEDDDY